VALRLISLRLPAVTVVDVEAGWARGDTATEDAVEAALTAVDPDAQADRIEVVENGTLAVRSWRVNLRGAPDLKALAATLSGLAGVTRFQLDPRDG
jgi:putative Mg2+ transporter-C (MgtC) family protein